MLVGLTVRIMPVVASSQAPPVDVLFNTMLGIATAIFLLVEGTLVYSAIRFRRCKDETGDGLPIHGSNRLEIAWTLVPILIVLWLGVYSYQILAQFRPTSQEVLTVEVTAFQFDWEFGYPEYGFTSQDLYLPAGRPVQLKITSRDVIHAFWVPQFRVKQDAIPGRETELQFTANAIGAYRVVCAELCGAGHARMGLLRHAVVMNQADFDAWVSQQQTTAGQPPSPAALFSKYGCAACHTLSAASATGNVGPNLDGIGTRAGTRVSGLSAEDYIRQSTLTPNAYIVEGFQPNIMPQDFAARMPQSDLETLVNFLLEQN
ncbi:MAG: cytochrome c oxidase subunit II [Anaerolineales bacterium]